VGRNNAVDVVNRSIPIVLMALSINACALLQGDDGPEHVSLEKLNAAPTTVKVDGTTLSLETYLWRDFMPISPPDGKPLVAILRVKTDDGSTIPDGLKMPAAWVVRDKKVWDTLLDDEQPEPHPEDVLELVARDGPKWGPNVAVDVIVELRLADGSKLLLKAVDQMIERTD